MPTRVIMKPTSVIKARLGLNPPDGSVQKFFTNTCAKHMDKYVPYKRGTLASYHIEGYYIIYDPLYARYQYEGKRKDGTHVIKKRTLKYHPRATSHWDKKMVTAEMSDIVKEVQNYINRRGD